MSSELNVQLAGAVPRWKRYPAYQQSGVEWLGEVPSHWQLRQIGTFSRVGNGSTPLRDKVEYWQNGTFPWLNSAVVNDRVVGDPPHFVTPMAMSECHLPLLKPGTVLVAITGDGKTRGKAAVLNYDATINQHIAFIRPASSVGDSAFLRYSLESQYDILRLMSEGGGSTKGAITCEQLRHFKIALPPVSEQAIIVAFLNRKTSKIDTLIANKERLIELLQEKRTSLISHAVTRGIDAKVPMKDSGVKWLGKIPAHWGIVQSKRLFGVRNQPASESDEQLTASQKYGMLPQTEFMELEGRRVVATIKGTDSLRHVEPNDFVISLRSFQGGIEWCKPRGSVTFHYVVLKPVKALHPAYFGWLFKSIVYIQALRATTDFIRDGQDLRYSHFVLVPLPVVPMDEQAAIASYLDRETARLDSLIHVAEKTIDKLREYRSALISAAVTGKIDVREEVA